MTDKAMNRYTNNGVQVYDTFEIRELCIVSSKEEAEELTRTLNYYFDQYNMSIDSQIKLSDTLKEKEDYIDNIFGLIDLKIKENKQLALIHFPTPEDDYVNEYDSRALELEQLKKLLLNKKED